MSVVKSGSRRSPKMTPLELWTVPASASLSISFRPSAGGRATNDSRLVASLPFG